MKVSFVKKLRLAFVTTSMRARLLGSVFLAVYFFMLLGGSVPSGSSEAEGLSNSIISISGTIGYSAFIYTIMILMVGQGFVKIPFFKSMPLTKNDIIDAIILDFLISVLVIALVQSMCISIINIYAVPYFICAYAAQFAVSMLLMPLYMKDKNMYGNAALMEDDKQRKRTMLRGALIGIGYLAVSGTTSALIIIRGLRVCDPIADLPLLLGIFVASAVISCILIAVCHRIEGFSEN